jgi:hypothetical protein
MTDLKPSNDGEEQNKSTLADKAIGVLAAIAAMAAGRFLGLLGVGAIAFGWFVYDKTKQKLGRFVAVLAGSVVGLAIYGFAAFALIS